MNKARVLIVEDEAIIAMELESNLLSYGYEVIATVDTGKKAIDKGIKLLNMKNLYEEWQNRRQKMLTNKIDVTAFLIWFIENYPKSVSIIKTNPDYQYKFI